MINVPIHRIELNPTELCNRLCSFCPRAYDYPNLNLNMTADTAEEIVLQTNQYTNYICIAGRGEPLLCPEIKEICQVMALYNRKFYLQTNGDFLDKHIQELDAIMNLKKLPKNGHCKLLVNCYDGVEQKLERQAKWQQYAALKITAAREDDPTLEEYKSRIATGKYVNRGGYLPWTFSPAVQSPCYILFHKCYINWNGDIQICCHDWKVMKSFGNIFDKPFQEIWEGEELMKYRLTLQHAGGRQKFEECKNCDAIQQWEDTKRYYESWVKKNVTRTQECPSFE
tara:strand:- start:2864 stop:3712 length:849 start_codon:yes stop_codon:yes gene_type:complete